MENGQQTPPEAEINTEAVNLLLSTALNEYSNEHDRTATLDSKAGIALPIISAFFLSLAQMNNYKEIIAMPVQNFWTSLLPISLFVSYTAGLILILLAVAFMARVLFVKEFYRINPPDLYKDKYLVEKDNNLSITLMQRYFDAIAYNRNVNNQRVEMYQKSWKFSFLSVLCFVVYIMIKNNI